MIDAIQYWTPADSEQHRVAEQEHGYVVARREVWEGLPMVLLVPRGLR